MTTTPSFFITGVYNQVLRRSVAAGTATTAELLSWDRNVANGAQTQLQVANTIATSTEAQSFITPVVRIYQTFFNRVPDSAGFDFWVGRARAGTSLTAIASGFAGAPEFTAVYGAPSSSTIDSILTALYQNVLGRGPDSAGFQYWKSQFAAQGSGISAMASIAGFFSSSPEFVASSAAPIANLLTTAAFAGSLGSGALGSNGGGGVGQTLTFTPGIDILTGSAANDVFVSDNTAGIVLATGVDRVNGGLGTDTYKVMSTSSTAIETIVAPQLVSVEVEQLTGGKLAGTTAVLDISAQIGVTSLIIDSPAAMVNGDLFTIKTTSSQSLTFAKLNGTNVTSDNSTVALNGSQSVLLDTVGATNGALTLDISGSSSTLTLTTTGAITGGASAASVVTLTNTGGGLTSLSIVGDRNLTLTESVAALSVISAALATGAVAVDTSVGSVGSSFSFTGGSGNDSLTLPFGALGSVKAGSQLDGGAGTDTLALKETAVLTTDQAAILAGVKNFEVLGFAATGSGVDVSTVTNFTTFRTMAGKLSETFTNALATSKFVVDVTSGAGTVSIANGGGISPISTVTLENNATSSQTMTKLDVGGIVLLSLASTRTGSSNSGATVLTEIVNRDSAEIALTGSVDLTITKALQATSAAIKVDASAFTGKLSLIGSPLNDTIIGGTGADVIQAAAASTLGQADTLTGGAGADTFKLVATGTGTVGTDFATLMKESTGTSAVLRITDFVAGADKIHLEIDNTVGASVAGTSVTLATPQTVASAANLVAVWAGITPIAASTPGAGLNAVVVTVSAGALAGTYLYVNDATAGVSSSNDMLINLTGISGTLASTDFILA